MHGKIISKAGDYGFIHCAEGVAHFFSRNMLEEGVCFEALTIGSPVAFNPVAGPKGMRAKKVSPREVRYGWTTGEFLVLRGENTIPSHDGDGIQPPSQENERYTTSWVGITVPIQGDRDQVVSGLIDQAKAIGANAVDTLKFENRQLREGDARASWEVLTGRIVFYHASVEINSEDQYFQMIEEHNQLNNEVYPRITALQDRLDAENRALQLHIPYVIGDAFVTLNQGEKLHQDRTLLCGVTLTSPWYRDNNAGKHELVKQAQAVGANCIMEMTRLEKTMADGNYRYTMWAWVGHAGVWGRRKQVADAQEAERREEANKAHCDAVHGRLLELKSQLDMRSEDQSLTRFFGGFGLIAVVVVVVVALITLAS